MEALESFSDVRGRTTTESIINYGYIPRGEYTVCVRYEGLYPNIYEDREDVKYSLGVYVYGKGKIVYGEISGNYKQYNVTINDDLSFSIE